VKALSHFVAGVAELVDLPAGRQAQGTFQCRATSWSG